MASTCGEVLNMMKMEMMMDGYGNKSQKAKVYAYGFASSAKVCREGNGQI